MFITLIIGLVNISLSSAEYEDEITDDAIEDSKYVLQNHLNQKVIILHNFQCMDYSLIRCTMLILNISIVHSFLNYSGCSMVGAKGGSKT